MLISYQRGPPLSALIARPPSYQRGCPLISAAQMALIRLVTRMRSVSVKKCGCASIQFKRQPADNRTAWSAVSAPLTICTHDVLLRHQVASHYVTVVVPCKRISAVSLQPDTIKTIRFLSFRRDGRPLQCVHEVHPFRKLFKPQRRLFIMRRQLVSATPPPFKGPRITALSISRRATVVQPVPQCNHRPAHASSMIICAPL